MLVRITLPLDTISVKNTYMTTIPTSKGIVGILPRHSKFIFDICSGIVTIFSKNKKEQYVVHNGISQVSATEINVITTFAIQCNQNIIDTIENLNKILSTCSSELNKTIKDMITTCSKLTKNLRN